MVMTLTSEDAALGSGEAVASDEDKGAEDGPTESWVNTEDHLFFPFVIPIFRFFTVCYKNMCVK
jgi:hypothetical protein